MLPRRVLPGGWVLMALVAAGHLSPQWRGEDPVADSGGESPPVLSSDSQDESEPAPGPAAMELGHPQVVGRPATQGAMPGSGSA